MALGEKPETAVVSTKGQVVIPERFRRRYHIEKGTRICFFAQGDDIVLRPVTSEYISRGRGLLKTKGKMLKSLLQERRKDLLKEENKIKKFMKRDDAQSS